MVTENTFYPSLFKKKDGNCVILMLVTELMVKIKKNNNKNERLLDVQPSRELCPFTMRSNFAIGLG